MASVVGYAFKTTVGVINSVDSFLKTLGYTPLTFKAADLIKGLPKEALDEMLDPDVGVPLCLNARALAKAKRLTFYARLQEWLLLRLNLEARIAVKKAIRENPEISQTPLNRPVFIVGFPRTGTTLLFNLMAQDPQFQAPMFWELFTPFPPGRPENWRETTRYKKCAAFIESRKWSGNEQFDVAHVMRADLPEECLFLLRFSFYIYYNFMRMPEYEEVEKWFYEMPFEQRVRVYKMYKDMLQCIGYGNMDKKKYLLKAHVHLMGLDALLENFPDACLIFTRRPISKMLPSFCSMVHKGTAVWGPPDEEYGKRGLRLLSEFANRSVKVMEKYDHLPKEQNPILDLDYDELVSDPIASIRNIYNYFDLELTEETVESMKDYISQNQQHKHGKHSYSMEQYKIDPSVVEETFEPYLKYFRSKGFDDLI